VLKQLHKRTKYRSKESFELNTSRDVSESKKHVLDLRLANHSLLGLVDKIIAVSGETNPAVLRAVLPGLRDAVIEQFRREALAMREANFGSTVQHVSEHERLLTEIQSQIDALAAGSGNGSYIGRFLQNWFLQHIVSQDLSFVMTFVPDVDMPMPSPHQDADSDETDSFDEALLDINRPIRWTAKHAVDVQPIDENHRLIFSLMREIIEARTSLDKTDLTALLERLGDETATHFRNEEKVMADYNYEFAAAHREEHRKLLEEYAYQLDEYRNNTLSAELMCRFVYRWFVRHIEVSDIPLSNAIHQQDSRYQDRKPRS